MIVIFSARRIWAALLATCLALASAGAARADEGDSAEVDAQRLVHILGYTASDYGGAVANGAILSDTEYAEQQALLTDAAKIAARVQPSVPEGSRVDLVEGVLGVRALVEKKAPEADVKGAVATVLAGAVAAFHLSEAPKASPDLARGQGLYLEHCATCHGALGNADTDRARSLKPIPANFLDPKVGEPLSPRRVEGTIRFGIEGTAMVPFTFLNETDRWSIAFYVMGLRHKAAAADAPAYTVAELAVRSDADLVAELAASGAPADKAEAMLSELRRRTPYSTAVSRSPLAIARIELDRSRAALKNGDREVARTHLVDAYLEGIEPVEGSLRAADASIVPALEKQFLDARATLEKGGDDGLVDASLAALLSEITRAEVLMSPAERPGFLGTAISSGGILLREGVEAALLIAALLGVAAQAGLASKKRYVHVGWTLALALGLATWFAASRIIAISGASREKLEGVTALLATLVLFYVSYSLFAKKEVARWMKFLRAQVTPRRAALSLFGVAFLAAYREAFETVLFFQALLASGASRLAALVGAAGGAFALAALVAVYSRAGRFAPPQVFFRVSSYLLYGLAIVFAGQGIAALQLAGALPVHRLALPTVPSIGLYPTVETCVAQLFLVALALFGALVGQKPASTAPVQKTA